MLNKPEYRKQLKEELERENIQLDSHVIDYLADLLYDCVNVYDDFDIEERIIDNMAPDDSIVESFNSDDKECKHKWTMYDSGWIKYSYCNMCGLKKT